MNLNDALFYCVKRGNALKNIVALVEKGANPYAVDDKGRTLLHYAAERGDLKLINYMTQKLKMNPNIQDYSGQTSMHMAATQFYGNVISALHNVGGDVNATDKMGLRPLHIAAVYGHVPVASKLIKKGADISARTYAIKPGYSSLTAKEAAQIANQTIMAEILDGIEAKQQRKKMALEQAPMPVLVCSYDSDNVMARSQKNQHTKS